MRSSFFFCILFSLTACQGQTDRRSDPVMSDSPRSTVPTYTDPLFFLDGQLCQHVRKIFQDSRGDLWFGTNVYGLMRYDGDTLVYLGKKDGLGGGRITGLAEDRAGRLWISDYGGLTRFDGTSFTNYAEAEGLSDPETWCLLLDRENRIWVGTTHGVFLFDGKQFTPFVVPKPPVKDPQVIFGPDRITAMAQDSSGKIWFGFDGYGLTRFDGKSFASFTREDGLCDNTIYDLMTDSRGNLWIGTFFGGVSIYDGKNFVNPTRDGAITGEEAGGFFQDTDGDIWFAAENNGVFRYDGQSYVHYDEASGLQTNGILSIYRDRNGRLWLGGWGGLFRLDNGRIVPVTRNGPWN